MNETILFKSEMVEIGEFTITPSDALFTEPDCIQAPIIVFPKTSIWIQHEGAEPFVSDPTLVNFYNKDQIYNRYAISQEGDLCHWFRLENEALSELANKDSAHFSIQNTHCSPAVFMQQLQLLSKLKHANVDSYLEIEEVVFLIFQTLLKGDLKVDRNFSKKRANHQLLVEKVKATLHQDLSAKISLKELARLHHTSPYHLSRVFKVFSGEGISQYRQRQRLHHLSLELQHTSKNLIDLAFDYGFCSHSHMSASFKSTFGFSPSERRQQFLLQ